VGVNEPWNQRMIAKFNGISAIKGHWGIVGRQYLNDAFVFDDYRMVFQHSVMRDDRNYPSGRNQQICLCFSCLLRHFYLYYWFFKQG
jgi:hypothetical protein